MSDDFESEHTPADEHPPTPRTAYEHHVHGRLGSLESSRRFWRWVVGLGAPVLGTGLFLVMLWAVDKVQSSAEHVGETRATIEAFRKTMDILDLDIRELRARILKLSGAEPDPGLGVVAVGAP